jgi:hypothetical protein
MALPVDTSQYRHDLVVTPSPNGLLYECLQGCGRRLVVERATGAPTLIDRGDPWALHAGKIGDIELKVELTQP